MKVRGEVCIVTAKTNHPQHREIQGLAIISAQQLRVYINIHFLRDTAIWEAQATCKAHADLLADKKTECIIQSWELSSWIPFVGRTREQSDANPLGRRKGTAAK